jgi:hypothetical protein
LVKIYVLFCYERGLLYFQIEALFHINRIFLPFFILNDFLVEYYTKFFDIIQDNLIKRINMLVAPSILSANFGKLNDEISAICQAGCDLILSLIHI